LRNNVSVALQYTAAWLGGSGAVAINDLMEDAATAEISRAQLWQWLRAGVELSPGVLADEATYRRVREEEVARLRSEPEFDAQRLDEAAALLDGLVLAPSFEPFLTVRAYERVLEPNPWTKASSVDKACTIRACENCARRRQSIVASKEPSRPGPALARACTRRAAHGCRAYAARMLAARHRMASRHGASGAGASISAITRSTMPSSRSSLFARWL
jgi:hypothetical protein